MTEFTTPSPSPPQMQTPHHQHHHLSTTLVFFSYIQLLFSFLISNPLYLSYFLFFSPSLLKLLSFLSPLFLTTSLLLLVSILLALSQSHQPSVVAATLAPPLAPDHLDFLQVYYYYYYHIVFDVGDHPAANEGVKEVITTSSSSSSALTAASGGSIMTLATVLLHQKQDEEGKEVVEGIVARVKSSKVEVGQREEAGSFKQNYSGGNKAKAGSLTSEEGKEANLGSYGSMRKEKEWRRTLACKLFEERHNADSSEGMDLLWETYDETETESESRNNNTTTSSSSNGKAVKAPKRNKSKQGKRKGASNKIGHHYYDANDVAEEEEEEMGGGDDDGRLCCLQALKFSAGKMNLSGMGKPQLVKISKAIKGFGWLHNRHPKTKRVP